LYTNTSDGHAAFIFRTEVRVVKMLIGYTRLIGGLGQGAQEDWPFRAMETGREM
jgi:hypothetical protein